MFKHLGPQFQISVVPDEHEKVDQFCNYKGCGTCTLLKNLPSVILSLSDDACCICEEHGQVEPESHSCDSLESSYRLKVLLKVELLFEHANLAIRSKEKECAKTDHNDKKDELIKDEVPQCLIHFLLGPHRDQYRVNEPVCHRKEPDRQAYPPRTPICLLCRELTRVHENVDLLKVTPILVGYLDSDQIVQAVDGCLIHPLWVGTIE